MAKKSTTDINFETALKTRDFGLLLNAIREYGPNSYLYHSRSIEGALEANKSEISAIIENQESGLFLDVFLAFANASNESSLAITRNYNSQIYDESRSRLSEVYGNNLNLMHFVDCLHNGNQSSIDAVKYLSQYLNGKQASSEEAAQYLSALEPAINDYLSYNCGAGHLRDLTQHLSTIIPLLDGEDVDRLATEIGADFREKSKDSGWLINEKYSHSFDPAGWRVTPFKAYVSAFKEAVGNVADNDEKEKLSKFYGKLTHQIAEGYYAGLASHKVSWANKMKIVEELCEYLADNGVVPHEYKNNKRVHAFLVMDAIVGNPLPKDKSEFHEIAIKGGIGRLERLKDHFVEKIGNNLTEGPDWANDLVNALAGSAYTFRVSGSAHKPWHGRQDTSDAAISTSRHGQIIYVDTPYLPLKRIEEYVSALPIGNIVQLNEGKSRGAFLHIQVPREDEMSTAKVALFLAVLSEVYGGICKKTCKTPFFHTLLSENGAENSDYKDEPALASLRNAVMSSFGSKSSEVDKNEEKLRELLKMVCGSNGNVRFNQFDLDHDFEIAIPANNKAQLAKAVSVIGKVWEYCSRTADIYKGRAIKPEEALSLVQETVDDCRHIVKSNTQDKGLFGRG